MTVLLLLRLLSYLADSCASESRRCGVTSNENHTTTYVREELVGNMTKASCSHNGDWSCFLACLHTLAHTRLSCCVMCLLRLVLLLLMLVRSTSVWLPRSQVHTTTTAFYFSPAQRAAPHPLALLCASITSNSCCCVTVLPVSVMACRVASLQVFGVIRSPPSPYVPSTSMILVSMFDSHCQFVLL